VPDWGVRVLSRETIPGKLLACVREGLRKSNFVPLHIPYETRSPSTARIIVEKRVRELHCGDTVLKIIVFEYRGDLRNRLYVCLGKNIGVVFEETNVDDVMSGLRLRVKHPTIVIDDCRVAFQWAKSRFTLTLGALERCKRCFEMRAV